MSTKANVPALVPAPAPIPPETKFVYLPGDTTPRVSSRAVAEAFGKEHRHILEQIKELILQCPYEFNEPNFRLVEYPDKKGQKRPEYLLSRDGFTLLCMGFTGSKSLRFKLAYIEAFNALEAQARRGLDLSTAERFLGRLSALDLSRLPKVLHYKGLGLNNTEIGRLLDCSAQVVYKLLCKVKTSGPEGVNPQNLSGFSVTPVRIGEMEGGHA